MKRFIQVVGLLVAGGLCVAANAHFVWVASEGGEVKVYFAESADAPEPDLLKNVADAKVWAVMSGNRGATSLVAVPLTMTDEKLSGPLDANAAAVVLAHDYGVVTKGDSTFLLRYFAKQHLSPLPGKWTAVNDTQHLPLEITPSWKNGRLALTVTWQGEPAGGVEVKASGCSIEGTLTTDESGTAWCAPQRDGILSVRAKYVDETKGELDGEIYNSVRTCSTLTFHVERPAATSITHAIPELPKGITSFGAAIAADKLYVYGGHFGQAHHYSQEGQSGEFRRISLTSSSPSWELLPSGPKLTGLALVENRGTLYRVGGFTARNSDAEDQSLWSQDSFASYDPASSQWTELPALPDGRSSHDAAVLDGKLYVVGGWKLAGPDETIWHKTALVCDLTAAVPAWQELPSPPFERRALSVAAFQGKLYCIGGMQESGDITTRVAIFNPETQTWTEGPRIIGNGMEGFGTSAFASGDQLVVTTMSGSVQTLSADAAQWSVAGQVESPRFFHRQLSPGVDRTLIVGGASMETGKTNTVELLQLSARTN